MANTLWTIGRQSKHHEFTVEDDNGEKVIKVDDSELPGGPRRFRITKEDIERVGHSDRDASIDASR